MSDNKVRLSPDVLEKAEQIAAEWGLKNVRAAVEAVFRRYADDYLHGREPFANPSAQPPLSQKHFSSFQPANLAMVRSDNLEAGGSMGCEALDALDELLGA